MKPSNPRHVLYMILCTGFFLTCIPVLGQDSTPKISKPINLDEALREPVPTDRAMSYYYYALSKLNAKEGDNLRALSLMKKALDYNRDSAMVHLELSILLKNMNRTKEAIVHAQEASRLDPKDPGPHWLLADIYFKTQPSLNGEFQKAVRELETIRELDPENGAVYQALGRIYFDQEQPEKAIEAYETFQRIVRTTDRGYWEIARYYYQNNNQEKAIEYLKKGLELQPESEESLVFLGKLYTETNRIREAIPIYRKLEEITGNDEVKQHLAALLFEYGEFNESYDLLEDILQRNPRNTDAKILLGRVLTELNEYDRAIETLQSVDSADPKVRMKVQFHLGIAYTGKSEYSKAIEIFKNLLDQSELQEENPGDRLFFRYHLISTYLKKGDNDKAVSTAKQGYEKNPDSMRLGIIYAQTLADVGRTDDGIAVLNDLLQANPSDLDLYIHLSQIYVQDKRFPEAESVLRQAENIESEDADSEDRIKIQRVSLYERQKDYDRAESLLKEVLKENPNHAGALNYFGYMLADRGIRLDEALNYVKQALKIDPENGAYLDSLGWAYFKLNDLENAERYLLKAGKREKNDPVINDHLGDLYFKTGDFEKARYFWMESIRIATEEEDIQKVREKLGMLPEKFQEQNKEK